MRQSDYRIAFEYAKFRAGVIDIIGDVAGRALTAIQCFLWHRLGPNAKLLPRPDDLVGIIAGDVSINPTLSSILTRPHDGKVTVQSTRLDGATGHIVVHAAYTFMMMSQAMRGLSACAMCVSCEIGTGRDNFRYAHLNFA